MNRRDGLVIARLEPGNDGSDLPPGIPYTGPYGGGIGGATQAHPHPVAGGQRIFLGAGGLPESAVDGWNVLTGTVSQTANGLEATLSASNTEVVIDLPVFGTVHWLSVMAELNMVCGTPGDGTRAGVSSELSGNVVGDYIQALSSTWRAVASLNAATATSSLSMSSLTGAYVSGMRYGRWNTVQSSHGVTAGQYGTLTQESTTGHSTIAAGLWAVRLHALWVSGDDLQVTWKSIAVLGAPLHMSTVD